MRILESDFSHFLKCLRKAGQRIDQHCFQLPVAGSEDPTFRERVYCYELYHQLRDILGNWSGYKLDGEVDKKGHPIICQDIGEKKPDFIVHVPGEMERNLVVMEVKPSTVEKSISRLRKDLKTLKGFLEKAGYYRAIMLIYGDGRHHLPKNIRFEMEDLPKEYHGRILLVWHQGCREKPEVIQSK